MGVRLFAELSRSVLPNLVLSYLKNDLRESVLVESVDHVRGCEALVARVHAHVERP